MSLQEIPDNFSCYVKDIKRCKQGNCDYFEQCKKPGGMEQSTYEMSRIHGFNDIEYGFDGKRYLKPEAIREYNRNIDEFLKHPARLVATPKELSEWYNHETIETPSPETHAGNFSVW